jgi:hypothetical protein
MSEITSKNDQVIDQTKKWITDVVIGCNFCPFASREVKKGTVHYQVESVTDFNNALQALMRECQRLDDNENIETILIIFPEAFKSFDEYLDLLFLAEKLMKKEGYEGIYQLASFHPLYRFQNAPAEDAANYTNRSIYPMLHLLREESVEEALKHYPDPENIPEKNIHFTRTKGLAYMKMLRDSCL